MSSLSQPAAHSTALPISTGLPPVAAPGCRFLVLGSLPGAESLRLQQYYAHPRNSFWELMASLYGFARVLPYPLRLQALLANDIAVWDVLASGHRPGSLDSAIDLASAQVNPFSDFLRELPALQRILFNGAVAERLFVQRVLPQLSPEHQAITRLRLPSTSPANASIPKQVKLSAWRAALTRAE
jgi:TDG/mug DNA glycosylase family protein